MSARAFLEALRADEENVPLPDRMCRIRIRVDADVGITWRRVVARCREIENRSLAEWEVLALVLHHLWREWDNEETRRQRREHPVIERDGWRCTAPGCGSMGGGRLHAHHIIFRSAGGEETDPANMTTLCAGHHLGLLHDGRMRCRGEAPDELAWTLGVDPGEEPFLSYHGEVRVGGAAG